MRWCKLCYTYLHIFQCNKICTLIYTYIIGFGGNRDEPDIVTVNNEQVLLYSRGHRILKGVYKDLLNNRGLSNATDIVITGSSAGGLATWLHSDWIYNNLLKNKISKNCYVSALPDSGYFINSNGYHGKTNYSNGLKWVFNNGNLSYGSVNSDCINYYGGQDDINAVNCVFAQNIAPFVNIPLFALNSKYDSWQTENILGSSNATLINEFGKNFSEIMNQQYLSTNNKNNSNNHAAFLDSCHHHTGDWDAIVIDNYTQATAHYDFYENKVMTNSTQKYIWIQNETYPCSSCCS